jgi:predicted HD superfamily hydrolase involved in NAD metabolism
VTDWRALLAERLSPARRAHSERVAAIAADLARRHGVDADKAALAGLLHDLCRELSEPELEAVAAAAGITAEVPAVLHGPVAAYLLQRDYGLADPEVLAAIDRHTTGDPEMTPLDAVVFVADLAAHGFPDLAQGDLWPAVLRALAIQLGYLLERRRPIDGRAIRTWNALLARGMLGAGGVGRG